MIERWRAMGTRCVAVFALAILCGACGDDSEEGAGDPAPRAEVPERNGIAVALLVDTSGSMSKPVADGDGKKQAKIDLARRCAVDIAAQVETFAGQQPERPVVLGVYSFSGKTATQLVPMGPPSREAAQAAVASMSPSGDTPIGEAVKRAELDLAATGMNRRHILVVTDGENTKGESPASVARKLAKLPEGKRPAVYLVAFDVDAAVFSEVKKAGWMVLSAANGRELQETLDLVVGENILLEK